MQLGCIRRRHAWERLGAGQVGMKTAWGRSHAGSWSRTEVDDILGRSVVITGHRYGHWSNLHEARRESRGVSAKGQQVWQQASLLWEQAWCLLGHGAVGSKPWARFEGLKGWVLFGPAQ